MSGVGTSLVAHQDQFITFLECAVVFLLATNTISIVVALAVIQLWRFETLPRPSRPRAGLGSRPAWFFRRPG